jgi:hypothetical protein
MFGASPWNSQEPETFATLQLRQILALQDHPTLLAQTLQRNGFMVIYGDLMAIYRDFTGFNGI